METRFRKATDPVFDADTITATLDNGTEIRVYVYPGDDGVPVVQVDTDDNTGRIRVNLNDGPVFDADPDEEV